MSIFDEACDALRINHQHIIFAYDHIGERFRTEGNTCETDGNTLYINEDWIKMVIRDNFQKRNGRTKFKR